MDIGAQDPQVVLRVLQGILGSTDDLISLLDEKGRFLYVNKVVPGLAMEQVIGTEVASYVADEYKPTVTAAIEKCFSTNQPVSYETAAAGPNNTQAYYYCRLSPCVLDGKPALLCIGTDVTKFKKIEHDLNERVSELEVISSVALDREAKMIDLKKEMQELKKENHS